MSTPFLSEIKIMAFSFPPKGWALCNGQFLPINQNQALFSLLGPPMAATGASTSRCRTCGGGRRSTAAAATRSGRPPAPRPSR